MEVRKVKHTVVPSAKRLINSLRNMSYDFVRAVADIIDNSIQSGSSLVEIEMRFNGEHTWVRIVDNGHGMSADELTEAMRFGSERDYGANELGRYGLGMKTASFSQCRKLTVASRNQLTESISIRQWDIDQIDETNRWEVDEIPPDDYSEVVTQPLQDKVGTVVLWEHLDRLLHFRPPDGERARAWFNRTADELNLHLGMVFHRFLSGEIGEERKIRITLNGTDIRPWDPFARTEPKTTVLPQKEFQLYENGKPITVRYSPYILPIQADFSSQTAFKRSSGPKKWNAQQGFYIYRENRLIQAGGWCRMRTPDEHSKYARVALDVGSDSDSVLMLDVTKSTVQLPADLREKLKPLVTGLVLESGEKYRSAKRAPSAYSEARSPKSKNRPNIEDKDETSRTNGFENVSGKEINDQESKRDGAFSTNTNSSPRPMPLGKVLEEEAKKVGEQEALLKIKSALKRDDPDSAYHLGW